MTPYWILKEPLGDEHCAIYATSPEMRNCARPTRGKSMEDSYSSPLDFKMTDQERGLMVPDVINNTLDSWCPSA